MSLYDVIDRNRAAAAVSEDSQQAAPTRRWTPHSVKWVVNLLDAQAVNATKHFSYFY